MSKGKFGYHPQQSPTWMMCAHPLCMYPVTVDRRVLQFDEILHKSMNGTRKDIKHMQPKTSIDNQSTATVRESYTTSSVTSRDGATIGYRQYGHGPGIVLVQGAMG